MFGLETFLLANLAEALALKAGATSPQAAVAGLVVDVASSSREIGSESEEASAAPTSGSAERRREMLNFVKEHYNFKVLEG